jgi:hypothetical protein
MLHLQIQAVDLSISHDTWTLVLLGIFCALGSIAIKRRRK